MISLKELRKVKTYDDLENLGIGRVYCDISYRGGGIGFYASDIARYFNINDYDLPSKFGAGCNYLGSGLRGCIFPSTFNDDIWNTNKKVARRLEELAKACVRVYEYVENEDRIENDIMEGRARVNGVKSAY